MKPSMSIILAGAGPKEGGRRDEDPKVTAMEDFISAVKAGDAEAAVVAYDDLMEACEGRPDGGDVGDEGDDSGMEYGDRGRR